MCVSCSSVGDTIDTVSGKVSVPGYATIRVQSNGMPNHCYSVVQSPNQSLVKNDQNYPIYKNLDFTVRWNPDVYGVLNVSPFATAAAASTLLCDHKATSKSWLPNNTNHVFAFGYTDTSGFVGLNMVNMPIYSSLMPTVSTAYTTT